MGLFGKWTVRLFEHSVWVPNLIYSLDELVHLLRILLLLIIFYAMFYLSFTLVANPADTNIFSFNGAPQVQVVCAWVCGSRYAMGCLSFVNLASSLLNKLRREI